MIGRYLSYRKIGGYVEFEELPLNFSLVELPMPESELSRVNMDIVHHLRCDRGQKWRCSIAAHFRV